MKSFIHQLFATASGANDLPEFGETEGPERRHLDGDALGQT